MERQARGWANKYKTLRGIPFFWEASVGVSPKPHDPKQNSKQVLKTVTNNNSINQIVDFHCVLHKGHVVKGLPQGYVATHTVEILTVDSGACDSFIPPRMFKNTPTKKHKEFGSVYKACGGENVINIGMENVKCITKEGDIRTLPFQVNDLLTCGLLAVS